MFNLLPDEQKKSVLVRYRLRVGIVVAIGLIITLAIAIAFLIPTFLYSRVTADQLEEHTSVLMKATENEGRLALAKDLEKWQALVELLDERKDDEWSVVEALRTVEGAHTATIKSEGFDFSYVQGQEEKIKIPRLQMKGVARDRQSLFDFKQHLEQKDGFAEVTLPVSNFAENINIQFILAVSFEEK